MPTRTQKRREKKKAAALRAKQAAAEAAAAAAAAAAGSTSEAETPSSENGAAGEAKEAVVVEYVAPAEQLLGTGLEQFADVFDRFAARAAPAEVVDDGQEEDKKKKAAEEAAAKKAAEAAKDENDDDSDAEEATVSKRKLRKLSRLSVAELKQLVKHPEVVEVHDVTAADPKLLVFLKSYRNSVPVPRHWSQKRKYLQGKRGVEKPPFMLPSYIADTGIEKMRNAAQEQDDAKKLKAKTRDRLMPKMGRVEIDYQVLHDAFFKYQTKPQLTRPGDLYYEGKEFEVNMKSKTPGVLSKDLKHALGMVDDTAPPPWLINMQRYGPPPSYPSLKIPGLNAPIPAGAQFGYHAGGWGKPPVDEFGNPLYGDVFGSKEEEVKLDEEQDKKLWGEMAPEESEEEDSEEEDSDGDEEEKGDAPELGGAETPMTEGFASVLPSATPDTIDLRKGGRRSGTTSETPVPQELYRVLEQKGASAGSAKLMGSSHTYVVPGSSGTVVALDPSELEGGLDQATLAARLAAEKAKASSASSSKDDLSDMLAEHDRKRKRKTASKAESKAKRSKELKDIKSVF